MNINDVYTIYNENSNLEPIRKTSKKVDLSKPTDTLNHIVKNQGMPSVYRNDNSLSTNAHKKVCLTKPNDKKDEKSKRAEMLLNRVILEEELKKQSNQNTTFSKDLLIIIFVLFISLLVTIASFDSLSNFSENIFSYIFIPMMLILKLVTFFNKKNR